MRLISTYSVVLPLNDLLRICGLGRHLQPARSSCFQFFDLADEQKGSSLSKEHTLPQQLPSMLHSDSVSVPTHLCGDVFAEELYSMLLHIFSSTIGHVLVEAPQQNGPNHDGDIETQAGKEPAALQSHIRCPDHQGLSRAVRQ